MVHSQAVTPNEALPVGITIIGVVQAHRVLAKNQLGSEFFHWFRFQNFLCNANACKEKLVIKSGELSRMDAGDIGTHSGRQDTPVDATGRILLPTFYLTPGGGDGGIIYQTPFTDRA